MGTSGGATVGVVTELVNVEGTLSVGVVAGDVPADSGGSGLGSLLEGDGTGDLGVTTEDSNCREDGSLRCSRRLQVEGLRLIKVDGRGPVSSASATPDPAYSADPAESNKSITRSVEKRMQSACR